jgi:hypothetical protein
LFLAHAAELTELFVTLATGADRSGLRLHGYRREGEAREPFEHEGKKRVLAPDALVVLVDSEGRELEAFVELDLGSMSHARLCQKAELYAAYAAAGAWRGRHAFQPALLFLTTAEARAGRFLRALAIALVYGPRSARRRWEFVAGAGGVAWGLSRLLGEGCLADLDGRDGVTLAEVLYSARAPHERLLKHQRARLAAEEEKRRMLDEDPEALREHLRSYRHALVSYARELPAPGETALWLLLASTTPLTADERGVLCAIAADLGEGLMEPGMHRLAAPGPEVRGEIAVLADIYGARQVDHLRSLATRRGKGPRLRDALERLCSGELLDADTLRQLPWEAERDTKGWRVQHECQLAYEGWRDRTAQNLARKAGPLGRLTHRPEDFYAELDQQELGVCERCKEIVYPPLEPSYGGRGGPDCHYCHRADDVAAYSGPEARQGAARR